jgi:hypothetical protein
MPSLAPRKSQGEKRPLKYFHPGGSSAEMQVLDQAGNKGSWELQLSLHLDHSQRGWQITPDHQPALSPYHCFYMWRLQAWENLLLIFCFVVLGIKSRALGKCSSTELHPKPAWKSLIGHFSTISYLVPDSAILKVFTFAILCPTWYISIHL